MGLRDRIASIRFLRRSRLQFGLKSLLAAMLVVCLVLGWYVEHVRRQQWAVAALREAGAYLEYHDPDGQSEDMETLALDGSIKKRRTLAECVEWLTPDRLRTALGVDFFRRVESVDVYDDSDHARALPYLRELRGLRRLTLECAQDEDLAEIGTLGALAALDLDRDSAITDAGLVHLAQLRGLECLKVCGQPISDAGLQHLAKLTRLKALDLSKVSIGDAGLRQVATLLGLESLDLSDAKITDDGLGTLAKWRRLKRLNVSRTAIDDAGLSRLADMSNLEFLNVSFTGITDEGIASLRSLSCLKELDLSGTLITDRGLHLLADAASLEKVCVRMTAVTPDGAAWLERRLPQGKVAFDQVSNSSADVSSLRAVFLLRAGRWREALEAISKLDDGTVPPYDGSFSGYDHTASLFYRPPYWARARGLCRSPKKTPLCSDKATHYLERKSGCGQGLRCLVVDRFT